MQTIFKRATDFYNSYADSLTAGYTLSPKPSSKGGHNLLWSIFDAKSSPSEKVSIFILEKQSLKEEILAKLRLEPKNLAKFRHPNILRIIEPLRENSYQMVFVTERVKFSLAYLFDKKQVETDFPSELNTKIGFLDLFTAIKFLHFTTKSLHLNISPCSIYITEKSQWKLAGFQCLVPINSQKKSEFDFNEDKIEIGGKIANILPDLRFSTPELI